MSIPVPLDEEERLRALERYKVLDTPPEEAFDKITRLAALSMEVPIALVSLVDRDRQWFKSRCGLDAPQTPRDVAFCAHAICDDRPLVVEDATVDPRFADNPLVTDEPGIRFYAGAPLRSRDGHNLGTLCVIDSKPRAISEAQLKLLVQLAAMVVDEFEVRLAGQRAVQELSDQEDRARELLRLATTDSLTGVLNRRAFFEVAEQEWLRAQRYGHCISLLAIDVDHFKRINDTEGHAMGDDVLKRLSDCVRASLRAQDVIGRIGGEEFAVLAPNTSASNACVLAARLKDQVADIRLATAREEMRFTISIGLTECAASGEDVQQALKRADAALYAAKQGGRNRIECQVAA